MNPTGRVMRRNDPSSWVDSLLSPLEVLIVQEMCKDKTYKQVAAALNLSMGTVKTYMGQKILRKAGVKTKAGLAVWWIRRTEVLAKGAAA